jgi:hypothetical protein
LRESIDGLRQQNAEIARSLPDAATGVEGGR